MFLLFYVCSVLSLKVNRFGMASKKSFELYTTLNQTVLFTYMIKNAIHVISFCIHFHEACTESFYSIFPLRAKIMA